MRFTLAGVQPEISCHHRQANGNFHQVPCTSFITSPSVLKSPFFQTPDSLDSYGLINGHWAVLAPFRASGSPIVRSVNPGKG